MTEEKKELVFRYLQEQIAQADFRAKAYVFDENNERNPTRNCFVKLNMHLNNFLQKEKGVRWLILTGFRGVGKTTLLSQIYYGASDPDIYKLYLSVDQITQIIGVSLQDALSVYEEVIGVAFERLEKPLVLFLDEVQYDPKWAITLKTIYDRSNNVFIIATGSSALSLQNNADVARRAFTEKLFPMCFTEYIKVKDNNKYEEKGLSFQLRKAIYESTSAEGVYKNLKVLEPLVRKYWTGIERLEIDRYMRYGTLPFAVKLKNEGLVYDQIKKILDRIISMDIVEQGQFRSEILTKIPEILYVIAASDTFSVTNLSKDIGISKIILSEVMAILEKTETIIRIYPYGSHVAQVRKPSKYLFASPAFRAMYYNLVGNIIGQSNYSGKLLEDTVCLYITRYFSNKNYSLTYDNAQEGADFILRPSPRGENIIIEVGLGAKGFSQIANTARRVKMKYGLVISMSQLRLNDNKTSVTVPLSYFLLT